MEQDANIRPKELRGLERKFCAFLEDVSLKRRHEKPHVYLRRAYGPHCAMLQWGEDSFFEVVAAAQKLCPNISTRQIAKALRDLMVKMFEDQAVREDGTADFELESITEILDTSNVDQGALQVVLSLRRLAKPQVVFVPIEGLTLKVRSLPIGSITLHPRSSASELDQALRDIEERIGRDIASLEADLQDATCYARVEVVGDDYFVRDEAIRCTREAIHILNLYLSSSQHQLHHWASIRVARVIINRTLPDDQIGFNQSFPVERPFELDWNKEQSMLQSGLETISSDFQPQNNSEIAKRTRQAVTWYSKAVDADSPEEKFVNLAIALESLLIGQEGKGPNATTGSINQRIGERVAFLLGDDFESRVYLEKTAKELYGLRSAIVHSGELVTQNELAQMDDLVVRVALAFLKHEFNTWSEFREWIAHERYNRAAS